MAEITRDVIAKEYARLTGIDSPPPVSITTYRDDGNIDLTIHGVTMNIEKRALGFSAEDFSERILRPMIEYSKWLKKTNPKKN